jgi:hypothetical protein
MGFLADIVHKLEDYQFGIDILRVHRGYSAKVHIIAVWSIAPSMIKTN